MEQEKEILDLSVLILNCFKEIGSTNNIEHFYQLEIYLKEYIRKYIDLNKKRIESKH